jgi:hypothetical protein
MYSLLAVVAVAVTIQVAVVLVVELITNRIMQSLGR